MISCFCKAESEIFNDYRSKRMCIPSQEIHILYSREQ